MLVVYIKKKEQKKKKFDACKKSIQTSLIY